MKKWLDHQSHRVMVNGLYSTCRLVTTGVPQGSALESHQLFITFIRDMAAGGSSSRGQPWVLVGSELSQGQTCAWAATGVSSPQGGMSMARPMRTVAQAEHKRLRQQIRWRLLPRRTAQQCSQGRGLDERPPKVHLSQARADHEGVYNFTTVTETIGPSEQE